MDTQSITSKDLEQLRSINCGNSLRQMEGLVEAGNDTEARLNGTLLGLATFLFTFTAPFFSAVHAYPLVVKALLFAGWISLLFSIVAGVIGFICVRKFYQLSAVYSADSVKAYANPAFPSIEDWRTMCSEAEKARLSGPKSSSDAPQFFQLLFLATGFLSVLIAASVVLWQY